MPITDSAATRELLAHIFPTIQIEANLRPSGQRLVYFCNFGPGSEVESQQLWNQWGPVVLKLSEDLHPSVIARLEKEREILNSIDTPYFPRLLYFDVFAEDPVTEQKLPHRLFITIEERIPGAPLTDSRNNFATERAAIELLSQLVKGMTHLWNHPQKIIHRDLKPDNILIRPDSRPVIIDLGIIREEGSAGVTHTHAFLGPCTPAYASPEQLRNQKNLINFKADFFSLGVIAYELMSGANPFMLSPHDPIEDVCNRALTLTPPSLSSMQRASLATCSLVARLMSKEPYQRPRSVQILADELSEIARGL